jgi:hypothetical protein
MKTSEAERAYKRKWRAKQKAEDEARIPWWKDRVRRRQVMAIYDRTMNRGEAENE